MGKRVLYIDPYGGASGDMLLGALLDMGAALDEVNRLLRLLDLDLSLRTESVVRGGLAALKATVMVGEVTAGDVGPGGGANHTHSGVHSHQHEHRSLSTITKLIQSAGLPDPVAAASAKVFERLAIAEAAVHGSTIEEVHFHEVGAADAIGDVVGVCACLDVLGQPELLFGTLPTGSGTVRSAHGELPLPAPATLRLLEGFQILDPGVQHEMVTPTGAAILTALGRQVSAWPAMTVLATGIGAGTRDTSRANVVRAVLGDAGVGREDWQGQQDQVIVAESNLDDASGQLVATACQALLDADALDAWWAGVGMKKGRPGVVVSFLCRQNDLPRLAEIVFRQLPTLGIRYYPADRLILDRKHVLVNTEYGPLRIKLGLRGEQVFGATPEYEDCLAAAAKHGAAVRDVQRAALLAASQSAEVRSSRGVL